jgi:polyisoprenoid-binding protein YceI
MDGTIHVHTFREGLASRAGHDLILEVTAWEGTADLAAGTAELSVDPHSLQVREGRRGVKPLTDADRAEIRRTIDAKVLKGAPIRFRSTSIQDAGEGKVSVAGDLELNGRTQPVSATLDRTPDGRVTGSVEIVQTRWGIKPYTAFMGALKVRDAVDVVIDLRA